MHAATNGMLPLHAGAKEGDEQMARLLLAAAPAAATASTVDGAVPLLFAAAYGHERIVHELLKAAPAAAWSAADNGWLPLHAAAARGHPGVVSKLLQAAPEAAAVRAVEGGTSLELALQVAHVSPRFAEVARHLAAAGPANTALRALAAAGAPTLELFAGAVKAHLPLDAAQWALVPARCPGLGRALPAALDCSTHQAAQLVQRLPAGDAQRVRTSALCLVRAQRQSCTPLPQAIAGRLIAMFDT